MFQGTAKTNHKRPQCVRKQEVVQWGKARGRCGEYLYFIAQTIEREQREFAIRPYTLYLRLRPERMALERKHSKEGSEILTVLFPVPASSGKNSKGEGPERLTRPEQPVKIMEVPATVLSVVQSPPGVRPLWATCTGPSNKPEMGTCGGRVGSRAQNSQDQQPKWQVRVEGYRKPDLYS